MQANGAGKEKRILHRFRNSGREYLGQVLRQNAFHNPRTAYRLPWAMRPGFLGPRSLYQ